MLPMKTQAKAKKTPSYIDQNPVEAIKNIGSSVGDAIVNDFGKQSVNELWEQLLRTGSKEGKSHKAGDLEEGQELHLGKRKKNEQKEHRNAAPALDYHREIVETQTRATREGQQIIQSKIHEILAELKKISETSTEIAMEFKEVTIEQRIENPGEYHISFFQWMLTVVQSARAKIEDSGAWLAVMKSKKSQRNYWTMFKKHGTTFGLSNERVVATQTG